MYVTIGQYFPGESFLHGLDPRGKIIFLFLYIVGIFMCNSPLGYALGIGALALAVYLGRVPFGLLIKGLRGVLLIMLFTVALNIFFNRQGTVVLSIGIIKITDKGLLMAVKIILRLSLLIIMSSVVTLTTTYLALADAIECFLRPLKVFKVPAHEIAMMITIALRFVPTLFDEMEKIKLAQMSRGASFDEGGFMKKVKSIIPLLIPLFISSFRTADNLAVAMEARCYRGDIGRTRYKVLKYRKKDIWVMAFGGVFLTAVIVIRIFGI